jgi:hypothetical protein
MTGEWADFLLSEVVLTRLGVPDLRIIGNVARINHPITSIGLNRRAVCSGSRFREQRFQSNLSLLPPERRCEEKGMLSVTKTHQRKGAFP